MNHSHRILKSSKVFDDVYVRVYFSNIENIFINLWMLSKNVRITDILHNYELGLDRNVNRSVTVSIG